MILINECERLHLVPKFYGMSLRSSSLIPFAAIWLLAACNTRELEQLRSENDSLRRELETRHNMVAVMHDVESLLDSIDATRDALSANLREGVTYENFTGRLREINEYIKRSQDKISSIEQQLKSSNTEAAAYLMMVDALKGELEIRAGEISNLEKRVAEFEQEKSKLLRTVDIQEAAMTELQVRIASREQELRLLEAKVDEMVKNFQVTEAEAYYARGRAVEEAARRTKLARNKRRETYREALELYKKAFSLGKLEAKENIAELEKKI